jgi:hypothetical protein
MLDIIKTLELSCMIDGNNGGNLALRETNIYNIVEITATVISFSVKIAVSLL